MLEVGKRLVEVNQILLQLNEEDFKKIPQEVILNIRNKMDKNYEWVYDEQKELLEQNIHRDTIVILSYINLEYLLNEEQKKFMKEIYRNNDVKKNKELQKRYNSENLFKNKENMSGLKNTNMLVEMRKESIFKKFVNFIKGYISKKE